jgi:hypothetical protein
VPGVLATVEGVEGLLAVGGGDLHPAEGAAELAQRRPALLVAVDGEDVGVAGAVTRVGEHHHALVDVVGEQQRPRPVLLGEGVGVLVCDDLADHGRLSGLSGFSRLRRLGGRPVGRRRVDRRELLDDHGPLLEERVRGDLDPQHHGLGGPAEVLRVGELRGASEPVAQQVGGPVEDSVDTQHNGSFNCWSGQPRQPSSA